MKNNLPYNVLRNPNDWSNVPRVEVVAAYFFPTAIAAGGTAAFLATAATYLAVSAVTSWAIAALAPKPDFSSFGSQGTLVNARNATAPVDFVYGEVRKGGTITYYESTGDDNKFLHQIIVLAGHEVAEIGDIYINEEVVTLDSNGYVTDAEWVIDGGANASGIRIFKHDGSQTSTADTFANSATESLNSTLLTESELTGGNALDANFVGRGIAYLYVRYEFDQTVFANGVPLITAKVKGRKVYDPRTGVTGYSNNAALCIRDFITSEYGLNDSAVDDVVFSAAANESDESVTLSGSGTEKRYTINGIIKASSPTGKVLGEMSTACAGTLFWGSGYWKLKVGAYSAPVKTLTLDDLRGPINLSTRSSMRDSFNGVTGTFNDASADFITADYPPIKSSTFQTEDGGDELLLDLPLPFTTSAATAQRIAKMTLYRGREQMTISADFGLEAFNVEVGDIIAFTNDRYGFDEKEFEVIGWRFESNQEAGDLRVNLTLQETSAAAFDWNAEESDIIGNETNLPVAGAGLTIRNLTASGGGRTQADGTFINSAILDWDDVTNAYLDYYEVEWKPVNDSVYSTATSNVSDLEISPIIKAPENEIPIEYTARVRAVTMSGFKGPFADVLFTGGGDTIAPGVPTSLEANGGFGFIEVEWVNPADADLNYVQVFESEDNNVANASLVGRSSGNNFIRSNLSPLVTRYYWVSAVDYSGNESDKAGPAPATTSRITTADIGPAVITFDNFTLNAKERIEGIESEISGYLNGYEGTVQQLTLADMTSLSSDIAGTYASSATLTQNYYTIAGADAAISSAITSFESSFIGDNDLATNASISEVYYTKAETDSTITSRLVVFAGQVADNFATISSVDTIEGDVNGIEAKHGVTIDNNGSITGYQLLSGAGGSAFNVRADQFAVFNSTGAGGDNPFTVFTSSRSIDGVTYPAGTYVRDAYIDKASIVNASIDTLKVAGDSITITDFTSFSTQSGNGPYTFTTQVYMAYSGDILGIGNVQMFGTAGSGDVANFRIYIDGSLRSGIQYTGSGLLGLQTLSASKTVSSGTRTVQVTVSNLSGIVNPSAKCQITIFRRYR